jgi:hypothetical protein
MSNEQPSVADIFRRAQAIRVENPQITYKDLAKQIAKEYQGQQFPSLHTLTIPEQDSLAPQEDWSAGLPLVRRGIQFQDWNEVAQGIVLSFEQTAEYARQRGPEGTRDDWHDRSVGINDAVSKGVGKWMPEELMKLAEERSKK